MKHTETASSHPRSPRRHRPKSAPGELHQLIRAIQTLTLEVAQLRREEHAGPEIEAKEHALEQLRWRLAALARRLATGDCGDAA